jgi:putative membrane protein
MRVAPSSTLSEKREKSMRILLTAAVASLAIATTACQKAAENEGASANTTMTNDAVMNDAAMNDGMANDMNMANGMAPAMSSDFVSTVAASDMFEIASGKLAQANATKEENKKFGAMLVADHTKSSTELKTAAAAAKPAVTPPAAMPAELQAKLDALQAAKGAEFDKLFVQQQKDNHQIALRTLQSYASGGDAPSLKAFAGKTAPVVQHHLDMLNGMKM